jgi:urease accessory protein
MRVEVEPQARVQLTTTSATRLYRSSPARPEAAQISEIIVDEHGLLEYLPDPLIPFAGSRYRQETRIELKADAGLFWWEIVAPGRAASGELFAYERLDLKLEIKTAGRAIASERNRLTPRLHRLDSPVRLGHYQYFCSFYICRVGLEAASWLALEKELGELTGQLTNHAEVLWGVSTLPAHGLIIRGLSVHGRLMLPGLMSLWRAAKLKLYGCEPIPPRKVW